MQNNLCVAHQLLLLWNFQEDNSPREHSLEWQRKTNAMRATQHNKVCEIHCEDVYEINQ